MKRLLALALLLATTPTSAFEPVTHAGLTERAALASTLHKILVEQLGRPLGLYERLRVEQDPELKLRLSRLDPEGGYVPDDAGVQTALAWLTAGSVLEGVPAHRTRNHFFDPSRGEGLADGTNALRTRVEDVVTGIGTLRGVFTGASFDGTGMASPAWMIAPRTVNDWSLQRFLDERERAAIAPTAAERDDALARALLAAGSIAHLIEDAGDPAYVRNDYAIELEQDGAPFDRLVADEWGRVGVPMPDGAIDVAHLQQLFRDGSGHGLAERTQRRFFSDGTLPESGRYDYPRASAGRAREGYASGDGVAHLARYTRTREGIRWSLDDRCRTDYAATLLPEIGRYARAALDLLFHGRLAVADDGATLHVTNGDVALGAGTVALYADDRAGTRARVASRTVVAGASSEELLSAPRPSGAKRVAAVFRGYDAAGEPIVIVRELALK